MTPRHFAEILEGVIVEADRFVGRADKTWLDRYATPALLGWIDLDLMEFEESLAGRFGLRSGLVIGQRETMETIAERIRLMLAAQREALERNAE